MFFFTKFFNSIKYRSSLNFFLNIFFIKQLLGVNINHTLLPHYFLPLKNLKIKFLNSEIFNFLTLLTWLIVLIFSYAIFLYVL